MTTVQFIIDPQKDFMTSPNFIGALSVAGAYEDMLRLANYIQKTPPEAIVVTLDTHSRLDIAHQLWWIDSEGNPPPPYTVITAESIKEGQWRASDPTQQSYSEFYVKELSNNNKYQLMIWPDHCIEGTEGHQINDELMLTLKEWENKTNKKVTYVHKGTNPKTEHYSGLKAEVVLEEAEETKLNIKLIEYLNQFDKIEISGEALSHCVGSSMIDLLNNLTLEERTKVSLLTDCTSPVTGFENQGKLFLEKAQQLGANLKTSQDIHKIHKPKY